MKKVIITIIVTLCAVSVFGAENNPREIFILNTTRGIEKGFDLAKKRITPEQREKIYKAAEVYADKVVAYAKAQGVYDEWAKQLMDAKNIDYNYRALAAKNIDELLRINFEQLEYISETYPTMWENLTTTAAEKLSREFTTQLKEIIK